MKNIKVKGIYVHIIEYYKDNKLVDSRKITSTTKEKLGLYWSKQKELFSKYDNGYVELDNYVAVSKCVRDYDYSINKIIETIETE